MSAPDDKVRVTETRTITIRGTSCDVDTLIAALETYRGGTASFQITQGHQLDPAQTIISITPGTPRG